MAASLLACSRVPVVRDVPSRDAEHIVAVLGVSGIAARAVRDEQAPTGEAFDVEVSNDDVARAVQMLHSEELPHRDPPGAADVYASSSLIPGFEEARNRETHAIEGELARTLETWNGVLSARVHVSMRDPLSTSLDETDTPHATASVLLHVAAGRAAPEEQLVRVLVAGAVVGMRERDVRVVTVVRNVPGPAASPFEWIGPLAVSRATAVALRRFSVAALAMIAATALAVIIVRMRRIRRSQV